MLKEIIYKSLGIITAGKGINRKINGYTLRMPTRYFKYFPEDYEKENFTFLATCKKDDVVLDIGAHIGMFAVIASQITGKGGKGGAGGIPAFDAWKAENSFHPGGC